MTGNERYVFSDTELAEARLRLLAEVFEPTTRRFIQDVVRAPVDLYSISVVDPEIPRDYLPMRSRPVE